MATKPIYTRGNTGFCGKLVALVDSDGTPLPSTARAGRTQSGDTGYIVVEFPCMPEDLTFARRANYNVQQGMFMPDGAHFYQHTSPLEIPFTFRLRADDPVFCAGYGPMALLDIAARLHALALPVNKNNATSLHQQVGFMPSGSDRKIQKNASPSIDLANSPMYSQGAGIKPPHACSLQLMQLSRNPAGYGINCRGYVRDVTVKLMGPWMRGRNGQYNLPAFGEYSFTFVHVTGYSTSWWDSSKGPQDFLVRQAFSGDVADRFYNTNYIGQNANDAVTTPDPAKDSQPPTAVETFNFHPVETIKTGGKS